jgi:murein DD-endopeptidase MepM/ murein hydrolase activator NlpD
MTFRHALSRAGCGIAAALATLTFAPAASAASSSTTGGLGFEKPAVTTLACADGQNGKCPRGALLRLKGSGLEKTRVVRFTGGKGKADDRTARPVARSPHRVVVEVPSSARSGAVSAVVKGDVLRGPKLQVLPSATQAPPAAGGTTPVALGESVFPIAAKHAFGTAINGFGGGRGHQGQDILARCGAPVLAALSGEVHTVDFHSAAGNFVVINSADGRSQAYMHLRERGAVSEGDTVVAGDRIGRVGQTGRASACHLHFELWTSPGWYQGGKAIDPLPLLRSWDRQAVAASH